jgi:hypothetical protein
MSIPFLLNYAEAVLDENLERSADASRVRLKTVDDIMALYHFDDPKIGGAFLLMKDAVNPIPEAKAIAVNGVLRGFGPSGFDRAASFLDPFSKIILPAPPETWGQLQDLTVRFRYRVSGLEMAFVGLLTRGHSSRFSFRVFGLRDGLGLECSHDGVNADSILFVDAGDIQEGTFYEVQAVMGADRFAALSLDGVEKVSIQNWNCLPLYNPPETSLLPIALNGPLGEYGAETQWFIDELIFYQKKMPTNYTPAGGPTKPFRQAGQGTLVLDSGSLNARWYPNSLNFTNEEAFSRNIGSGKALGLSYGVGNALDPELLPGGLTLPEFKALDSLQGRCLKLRFNFLSDQEYPTTLYGGWIYCTPALLVPRVIERQQPEIVRR